MKYLNRDISWMAFNTRVSDEAAKKIPLADKVMFHGITFSNLDEFSMVRYPIALSTSQDAEVAQIVSAFKDHYLEMVNRFVKFNREHHIIRRIHDLKKETRNWLEKKFRTDIFPALQPITVDKSRPMNPRSGTYLFVVTADASGDEHVNYIEFPKMLDRFIAVPGKSYVVTLEDLITDNLKYIFRDRKIENSYTFSILRSAEVYVQTHRHLDPYQLINETLQEREKAWITRVDLGTADKKEIKRIRNLLPVTPDTLFFALPYVALSDLKKIPSSIYGEGDQLRTITPVNTFPSSGSIFDYIRKDDRLAFHPYESYQSTMVRFLEEAAVDPNVVSIKISLYRVSDNSDIIAALLKAASKGKIVTVLVELKARFDEHHNMEISDTLREGGVRLVYTDPSMKTHAKLCLVTRKEKKGLRIYAQVGTGNYSESNARQYTDYSYFTCDQEIGYDLTRFFNLLTSDQGRFKSRKIIYAPYNMRDVISENIDHEIKQAKAGKSAKIICKCNSLTDIKMADKLVAAARAGVKVTMIIRGACILQPMKNLDIYSIVGQFLEHSRVYVFGTGKRAKIYIGSADLMHRNLSLRNELLLLIEQEDIRKRLLSHINAYLRDTVNRRIIKANYAYQDIGTKSKHVFNCQQWFMKEAKRLRLN